MPNEKPDFHPHMEKTRLYLRRSCREAASFFLAVLLLLVGALDAKSDECKHPNPYGFGPGRTTVEVPLAVKKNTPCTVSFTRNPMLILNRRLLNDRADSTE